MSIDWHFWLNVHQVVDEPAVAPPVPGVEAPSPAPGMGRGAAGAEPLTMPTPAEAPALPTHGADMVPRRPHLDPPRAARISAGITWN